MKDGIILSVAGAVRRPLALGYPDLLAFSPEHQVPDISARIPGREGTGVPLCVVLEQAQPLPDARFAVLHSSRDDFRVRVPLGQLRDAAIVVYALNGQPLPDQKGGPIRLLSHDAAACKTHALDECTNVKHLDSIEIEA